MRTFCCMRIHRRNFLEVVGVAAAAASLRGLVPALAEESVVPAPQGNGLTTGSTPTLTSASRQTIVLSGDWKSYWWALDNPWNTGSLVRGTTTHNRLRYILGPSRTAPQSRPWRFCAAKGSMSSMPVIRRT